MTSCHVAIGIKEETTTSSASANVEDLIEIGNLLSQQEVLAIQKGTASGLRFERSYKVNYDKPSTSTSSTPPSDSPSLVIPTGQDVNIENVNADVNERPVEPFKYDLIKHLKHIAAGLHILDLLQMSKETRDGFIRKLQALDPNYQVHVA